MKQTQIDGLFHMVKPEDMPEPYLDGVFKETATQWLIKTDQVIL